MRVSKLFWPIFLAMIAVVCFALTPITAGEHPWDEDQISDKDTTVTKNGSLNTGEDDPDDVEDILLGSSIWWLGWIYDEVISDESPVTATSKSANPIVAQEVKTPGESLR